jgi:hypothetical protein
VGVPRRVTEEGGQVVCFLGVLVGVPRRVTEGGGQVVCFLGELCVN